MNPYLQKLRTIGVLSPDREQQTRQWTHDGDRSGSFQTEHWDGSEDANIRAGGVRIPQEQVEEWYDRSAGR